jgi:hypothetical protein
VNRTERLLFAGLLALYVTTSSGGFETSDAVLRWETARSWVSGQGGQLPRRLGWDGGAVLPNGQVFCFFAPLQSVLMVPYVAVARLLPLSAERRDLIETTAISLGLFPLLSATALLLVFRALRRLRFSARSSLLAVLGIGLGSIFWYYARMGQEENLIALAFALWLLGTARVSDGSRWGLLLMSAGGSLALASRWASVPLLVVMLAVSAVLAWRHRATASVADRVAAIGVALSTVAALLLYNYARFDDPFQTGYGIWYAHYGLHMFHADGYANRLAALVVSPYRGLLVYSPIAVLAVAGAVVLRGDRDRRLISWTGPLVVLCALFFYASFQFWSGGHSWGPRFFAGCHVLLAPALASAFERWRRVATLLPLFIALQLLSVILPASTEEYVWFNRDQRTPGYCNEWRAECTPVGQRVPRALAALGNTLRGDAGETVVGRPLVAPERVLGTSDYRTLYWWPVRIAFRMGSLPLWVALGLCAAGLAAAAICLLRLRTIEPMVAT